MTLAELMRDDNDPNSYVGAYTKWKHSNWTPTGALRWMKWGAAGDKLLQQEWRNGAGERKWETVPLVDSDDAG